MKISTSVIIALLILIPALVGIIGCNEKHLNIPETTTLTNKRIEGRQKDSIVLNLEDEEVAIEVDNTIINYLKNNIDNVIMLPQSLYGDYDNLSNLMTEFNNVQNKIAKNKLTEHPESTTISKLENERNDLKEKIILSLNWLKTQVSLKQDKLQTAYLNTTTK